MHVFNIGEYGHSMVHCTGVLRCVYAGITTVTDIKNY